MDGVITFFSSQQVISAEKLLKKMGYKVALIPGPRDISPNCGTAICFEYELNDRFRQILRENNIKFENIHYYPNVKKYSKWLE